MRYMLPIYPFLTLMAASVLVALVSSVRAKKRNLPGVRAYGRSRGRGAGDHKSPPLPTPPPSPTFWINPHSTTEDDASKHPTRGMGALSYFAAILPCAGVPIVPASTIFH